MSVDLWDQSTYSERSFGFIPMPVRGGFSWHLVCTRCLVNALENELADWHLESGTVLDDPSGLFDHGLQLHFIPWHVGSALI